MKKSSRGKRFWLVRPTNILMIALCVILLGLIYFLNLPLFFIMAPIVGVLVALSTYRLFRIQKDLRGLITSMGHSITDWNDASLVQFPIPAVVVSGSGEILWYNDSFLKNVLLNGEDIFGYSINTFIKKDLDLLLASQGGVVSYKDGYYECYSMKNDSLEDAIYILYLVDITQLQEIKESAQKNKPAVILLLIDNYEESIGGTNEGQMGQLLGTVQNILQEFADVAEGFIKKLSHDRYLVIMKEESLRLVMEKRFDILDRVRETVTESRVPVTLSIGVSMVETSFSKAERDARLALDMALGRGGDQAAIKNESGYEFFGGFSKGVEKRTKVKTRMVAAAMIELIGQADNVLVMGHKFADLDCLGSAIGMAKACICLKKTVNIVLDVRRNLADGLVVRLENNGGMDLLLHPDSALDLIGDKTLLIIVDTHTENLLESAAVYKRCKQTIVIDHHRKMVNHIADAVIFYHEPYASSASEMVTELVQYFGDSVSLSQRDAEALLSGITLDTRNFVLRTGVRTFEAAAYLRRLGADTVEVRKLFASTMDSYQRKTRVVSSAEIYKGCAIASCDFNSDDLRIVAPQAADELLNISGVKASFVLYEQNDTINISARSMGALNVQVIMEALGGGGHHTMAAAQLPNVTIDKARQSLLEIIDKHASYVKPV